MERACRLVHSGEALEAGYTGRGITAAVIDTGIGLHPDISKERVRMFRDFVNLKSSPYDDSGHGTHVCGIMAGNGSLMHGRWHGIAPECSLVVLKALNGKGEGEASGVMAALKWILERKEQFSIRVLNMSFGAGCTRKDMEYYQLLELVERVWESGICVVTAAGNLGPGRGTITMPGCSREVITVGAAEEGQMAHLYSGRGPTEECVMKPDLVAPAAGIVSLMPMPYNKKGGQPGFGAGRRFGGDAGLWGREEWDDILSNERARRRLQAAGYAKKSGTSMATPMVSGAVCLLLQKEPGLTPKAVKKRLWQSCVDLGLPKEQQGHGLLDLRRLLDIGRLPET